ncbi:MAG: hypothetical protein BJ554DRAFT_1693, partial [Olpidium bornovanus]
MFEIQSPKITQCDITVENEGSAEDGGVPHALILILVAAAPGGSALARGFLLRRPSGRARLNCNFTRHQDSKVVSRAAAENAVSRDALQDTRAQRLARALSGPGCSRHRIPHRVWLLYPPVTRVTRVRFPVGEHTFVFYSSSDEEAKKSHFFKEAGKVPARGKLRALHDHTPENFPRGHTATPARKLGMAARRLPRARSALEENHAGRTGLALGRKAASGSALPCCWHTANSSSSPLWLKRGCRCRTLCLNGEVYDLNILPFTSMEPQCSFKNRIRPAFWEEDIRRFDSLLSLGNLLKYDFDS